MNTAFKEKLKLMAATPKTQIKRLAIGTFVSLVALLALVVTSEFEYEWLFYLLSFCMLMGIAYAIPGYIGIWLWRMKDTLFPE